MSHPRRLAAPLTLLSTLSIALAACTATGTGSTGSSTGPSSAPSGNATASPAGDGIDHPTGATDVILRYEETGGFIMPGFLAAQAPHFTLYGDGRVVFRNPNQDPPIVEGSVIPMNKMRTATLNEEQIQDVLRFALADGGLAVARATYENNLVADASTAVFTINAGGVDKAVSVYALGLEAEGVADGPARAAFDRLARRLADFDNGGTIPTDVYVPTGYRGVLMDATGIDAPDQVAWPWSDLEPADFVESEDLQFPHHVLTPEHVDALGLNDYEGGFQNLVLTAPDGSTTYSLSVRPLLPDEES